MSRLYDRIRRLGKLRKKDYCTVIDATNVGGLFFALDYAPWSLASFPKLDLPEDDYFIEMRAPKETKLENSPLHWGLHCQKFKMDTRRFIENYTEGSSDEINRLLKESNKEIVSQIVTSLYVEEEKHKNINVYFCAFLLVGRDGHPVVDWAAVPRYTLNLIQEANPTLTEKEVQQTANNYFLSLTYPCLFALSLFNLQKEGVKTDLTFPDEKLVQHSYEKYGVSISPYFKLDYSAFIEKTGTANILNELIKL